MENHSTATCKHTLPLETVGLFYSLKSHNILQVLPLVVHCPNHDTTLNTLDTSSLGSSTGSGLVMAWTGDRLQTAGATGSQSLARAGTWMQCQGHPEELLLLHQQQKMKNGNTSLLLNGVRNLMAWRQMSQCIQCPLCLSLYHHLPGFCAWMQGSRRRYTTRKKTRLSWGWLERTHAIPGHGTRHTVSEVPERDDLCDCDLSLR